MTKQAMNKCPKKTYSVVEKTQYYMQWKQSGISKPKFCRLNNLSRSAFYRWISEFEQAMQTGGFSPLMVEEPEHPSQLPSQAIPIPVQIDWAEHRMRLSFTLPEARLVPFIQEIVHATAIVR